MVGQPGSALGLVVLTAIAAAASTSTAMVVGAVVLAVAAPLYLVGREALRRIAASQPAERDRAVVHGGVSADGIDRGISRPSALIPRRNPCWPSPPPSSSASTCCSTCSTIGTTDLFNFPTFASLGLLLLSLYLAGVGSGPRAGTGSGRRFYGRRPGRG